MKEHAFKNMETKRILTYYEKSNPQMPRENGYLSNIKALKEKCFNLRNFNAIIVTKQKLG